MLKKKNEVKILCICFIYNIHSTPIYSLWRSLITDYDLFEFINFFFN